MYIWVVLAFFITVLYSYNLAFRADIREITVSPRAQSVASKVVIQHEAASRWVRDHSTLRGGGGVVDYTVTRNMFETQEVPLSGNDSMTDYLPYGYQPDVGPEYISYIYCVDKRNMQLPMDCNNEFAIIYLVTYGCVAQKWVSLTTGKPNKDLEFGISEAKKQGAEMGYVEILPEGLSFAQKAQRIAIKKYVNKVYEGEAGVDNEGNPIITGTGGVGVDETLDDTYQEWGSMDPDYSPEFKRYLGRYFIMRGRAEPSPIPTYIGEESVGGRDFHNTCVVQNRMCSFCLAYITSFR